MKVIKYLIPFWAAALVYAGGCLLWGPMGFSAYAQLGAEKARLQANLDALDQIHTDLENTQRTFTHDTRTIASRARELGYAAAGERFVRIAGHSLSRQAQPNPGQALTAESPRYTPDRLLRHFSFIIGALIFAGIFSMDLLQYSRRKSQPGRFWRFGRP